MNRTYSAKEKEIEKKWFVVDAEDQVLGRLASEVARRLRGKHKPVYTPHADTGDYIIVINAEKIRLTGDKLDSKKYYRYSGYLGGMKEITARNQLDKKPEELIKHAVRGMLPKNSLGKRQGKKLHCRPSRSRWTDTSLMSTGTCLRRGSIRLRSWRGRVSAPSSPGPCWIRGSWRSQNGLVAETPLPLKKKRPV